MADGSHEIPSTWTSGAAVVISLVVAFWSVANPRGDISSSEQRLSQRISEIENRLKSEFEKSDDILRAEQIKRLTIAEHEAYKRQMESDIERLERWMVRVETRLDAVKQ
jgi:biopolymer transport protein ExbB/TolQ